MTADKKVNYYDGKIVTEQDLDTEQQYNGDINSHQVLDFHGSGVVTEKVVYPVLLDKTSSTDRSTGIPTILDGIGITPDVQPSDSTFGNQLKLTLYDAVLSSKTTDVFIIGRVYDDSKDSKSSIAIEKIEFDREESQLTKNYFTSVLGVITQNFFGNKTPSITSSVSEIDYEGDVLPENATNPWVKFSGGLNAITTDGSTLSVSHDSTAYVTYILPVTTLRNNRFYRSSTEFSVTGVTTVASDSMRPNRLFTNIYPIFTYDGNKAIGMTLIDDNGTEAIALFDMVEFVENGMVLPTASVITPFTWNDGDSHVYQLEVSVDNNLVTLTADTSTIVSALYSSFSTYLGGLSLDLSYGANTYFAFGVGFSGATNAADVGISNHRNVYRSSSATECSSDRTQQIVGSLKIEEAEPLYVARDAICASQTVSPNIKFRSVSDATNELDYIVEPAFRVYDPDDPNVSVESVIYNIIGGSVYSDDLLEDIITPDVMTLTIPNNTSLSTIIGEKFLAKTDNIQKVRILLSVQQDTTKTGADQFDWSGDIIVGIRALQTTTACATDEAPINAIDFDPEFASIVEVSINQETLRENFGITLADVPVPVDFDFSQTIIATPGNITSGNYYVVTIRRSGDIRTGTIVLQRGSDQYEDGKITIFNGSSWTDDSTHDLWFEVYTDAVRVNAGSAYDRGVRITAEKTLENSTTGLLEQDPHGSFSLVLNARDENNYVVVEEQEVGTDVEAHPRTGDAVFSRLEDVPSFSVVSSDSLNTLKESLYPIALACVTDNNCRTAFTVNSQLSIIGLALGNTVTVLDTADDFLTLASEDLRGCIIIPDTNECDARYRVVNQVVSTQYFGDVTGDGEVDADDVLAALELLGESFSTTSTQEKIVGQKTVLYPANVVPENNGTNPWTVIDDTDPGVSVSTIATGGILTLNKTGALVPPDDTTYFWRRVETFIEDSPAWYFNFRSRITTATFLNPGGALDIESTMSLLVVQGTRIIPFCFIYDRLNDKKYIGLGRNRDTLYYSTSPTIDLNDFAIYEIDFTEFHTYKLELTSLGEVQVYVDGSITAAIDEPFTNFANSIPADNLENLVQFGDAAVGSIVEQWDFVNYFIQSVSSIDAVRMFAADINGNGIIDASDINAITDYINNGTPLPSGETFQTVALMLENLDDPCDTVNLVTEVPGVAQIPYEAVNFRLQCNCVWSDKEIQITDTRRLLSNVVLENGSTNCSDRGDNTLVVNNDIVIRNGDILSTSGLPYHFDHEVVEMTIELPNFMWLRNSVNIFDNFIKNTLKFSDGTFVGSSALQNNQVRVFAALQSNNDFFEYNIEGDGYGDGYADYIGDVAVYNTVSGWNTNPGELILGEDPNNSGESSIFLRFPVTPSSNEVSQLKTIFPYLLGAVFKMFALNSASPQDVYKAELIGNSSLQLYRDLDPFDMMAGPPGVFPATGIYHPLGPVFFKFYSDVAENTYVTLPIKRLDIGSYKQTLTGLGDILEEDANLFRTYSGGAESLTWHLAMFTALSETNHNASIRQVTDQRFVVGQHIGWKISRHAAAGLTTNEYISFDSGVFNITRKPKLNLIANAGSSAETMQDANWIDPYFATPYSTTSNQEALYFDHSTGILHINYNRPVRHQDLDARTKILLTIHLKKAGFINSNVTISSSQILNLIE